MYGSEFYNYDNAIQYAYEVAIIEFFYYGYDYILMLYSSQSRLIKRFRLAFLCPYAYCYPSCCIRFFLSRMLFLPSSDVLRCTQHKLTKSEMR